MDVVQSIWLSSITGAGLFMSVGLLVSRAFPQKVGPSTEQQAALQGESEARLRAESQIAAFQQKTDEAGRQLADERSQAAALRSRIQSDARVGEQLNNEKRLRDEAQQEVQRLSAGIARLESEAMQLRAAAGSAGRAGDPRQLADENLRFRAQLGQLGGEIEAYRGQFQQREVELNALRQQLAASENNGAGAQKRIQAAEVQVQRARTQMEELQGARARAEAEVLQLREGLKNAGQASAGGASASAAAARVPQLEAKVAELQRKANEADARQREVQQLTAQLSAVQAKSNDSSQLAQQLAAAQALLAQVGPKEAQQLAVAQAHAAKAHQLAQQLSAAQTQIRDARTELGNAEARAQEATRLRDENGALRTQIADLHKANLQKTDVSRVDSGGPQSLAEAQRQNVELSLKSRALAQRTAEFEVHAAEIESLRDKVEMLTAAASETLELRAKVRDLEAQGFAIKLSNGDGWTKRPAKSHDGPDRLESMLQDKLEALMTDTQGCRTAVLADLRGLLIAASGDVKYQDELAAAASLTTYTTERLRDLFPIGEPTAIEVVDVNRTMLRVDWLRVNEDTFLLTTVGVAPEVSSRRTGHSDAIRAELDGT
jgi:predicted regulator of Ras-like GTPase activity (Roadblock/LC7/MglB family)/chromosome segregation ATPase